MISDAKEGFIQFWETVTGVLDDDKAKLLRVIGLSALAAGMAFAGWNYFRAQKFMDLNAVIMNRLPTINSRRNNEDEVKKFTDLSQKLAIIKNSGENLAMSLSDVNKRLFRPEPKEPEIKPAEIILPQVVEIIPPQLAVKAIMLSGNKKIAVVNAGSKRGLIIRQGDELPEGLGQVMQINSDGIVIKFSGQKFSYMIR